MSDSELLAMREAMLQERRESVHGQLSYELECQLKARLIKPDSAVASPFAMLEHFFDIIISELADLRVEVAGLRLELQTLKRQGSTDSTPGVGAARKVSIASRLRPEPTQYRLSFGQRLPVPGWYEIEYTPEGVPFRWLGPKPSSTFDIVVSRRVPVEINVIILRSISVDVLKSVRLLIDGTPMPVTLGTDDQDRHILKALIPPSVEPNPIPHLSLTIEAARSISPQELDPSSGDRRELSIAVSQIEVMATSADKQALTEHLAPLFTAAAHTSEVAAPDDDIPESAREEIILEEAADRTISTNDAVPMASPIEVARSDQEEIMPAAGDAEINFIPSESNTSKSANRRVRTR